METNRCPRVHAHENEVQSELTLQYCSMEWFRPVPSPRFTLISISTVWWPKWKINPSDIFMWASWNMRKQYKSPDKIRWQRLTPLTRLTIQKLTVAQLAKKLPILCNPNVHFRVHNSDPLDCTLSQLNPVHILKFHFFKIYINSISPARPKVSEDSFPLPFSVQNLVRISYLFDAFYMCRRSHPPWLGHTINISWRV
jgi:hypothetical protein